MKKIILSILFLVLAQFGFSQIETAKIDSLKHLLQSERQDTSKCMLLVDLCWQYIYSKPDTALIIARNGLVLSKQIGFTKGEVYFMSDIGILLCEKGDNVQALQLLLQSFKKSETINSPSLSININIGIGHVFISEGDYKKSLGYDMLAMSIANDAHDEFLMMRSANSVGSIYAALKILDSAKLFDEKAYDLAIKIKDDDFAGVALTNLGDVHSEMGQYAIAMDYYRSALPFLKTLVKERRNCWPHPGPSRHCPRHAPGARPGTWHTVPRCPLPPCAAKRFSRSSC